MGGNDGLPLSSGARRRGCAATYARRVSCGGSSAPGRARENSGSDVDKKQSMYEILGVAPAASLDEIRAAHRRRSFELMSGKLGLPRDECDYRLKLLDVALQTLSDADARAEHDIRRGLAEAPAASLPVIRPASPDDEARALQLAAIVEASHRMGLANDQRLQFEAVSSTVGASARALKAALRIVVGLVILFFVLRGAQLAMASRKPAAAPPSAEVKRAEEMLVIQAYYKKHGVRPASRAEAELLEQEDRRRENERREAEFERERSAREMQQFAEEGRAIGRQVSNDIRAAEETARFEDRQRAEEQAYQEAQQRRREAGQDREEEE